MMWIFKLTEASMKPHYSIGDTMTQLITTLGPKSSAELGMILPHEHVFVDLRTWDQPGYGQGEAEDVIHLMAPEISKVKEIGVTAMVECSTVGVGRRADIDRAVSEATDFPLVVPTGIYREPWIPDWAHAASEAELTDWASQTVDAPRGHLHYAERPRAGMGGGRAHRPRCRAPARRQWLPPPGGVPGAPVGREAAQGLLPRHEGVGDAAGALPAGDGPRGLRQGPRPDLGHHQATEPVLHVNALY